MFNTVYCTNTDCDNFECKHHPNKLLALPKDQKVCISDLCSTCRYWIDHLIDICEKENENGY